MDALNILRSEHALIRQYIDNLALASEKLERGERPPKEFFEMAVDFSRRFVDKHHHFKEEHVMFTWLAQKKEGAFDASIEALRFQHERGRSHISGISNALEGYTQGREDKVTSVLENLAAYSSMLRHHIHREDHVFYPVVEKELAQTESKELVEAFDKENQKAGADFLEKSRELVTSMGALLT
jgi:hemerythrin-like domain-containing protein